MEVGLYILAERTVLSEGGATADSTLFTADTTLITADTTLSGASYSNVVVSNKIDLFDDEKISVNSSIQDISDISKIYTDFSQSFTVPASKNNNAVFKYWYESALDNGFDARTRKDAYIELDSTPFRKGKIQIEKANIKNNKPESYTITFFGSLISLKDAFNNKFLKDLDFSSLNFSYNVNTVRDKVTNSNNDDVKFPLISSLNNWQYGTGGNTTNNWDISDANTPIYTSDLFPAVRVSKILESISTDLGITFEGDFLTDERFTRAYLWLKNQDTFVVFSAPNLLQFDRYNPFILMGNNYLNFDFTDNSFNWDGFTEIGEYIEASVLTINASGLLFFGATIDIDVYFNGSFQYKIPNLTVNPGFNNYNIYLSTYGKYQFYVRTNNYFEYTASYLFQTTAPGLGYYIKQMQVEGTITRGVESNLDIATYMPDIKIEDFFTGILKMFNLTCYSDEAGIFKIEQLERFYNTGDILDITEHVDVNSIDVDRVKPFNKINFNYEKSESITNQSYLGSSSTPYADLIFETGYDGGDYNVKVPFENLLFSELANSNLSVGYALKPDLTRYLPKPVILYDYGTIQPSSPYFISTNNLLPGVQYDTYNLFGSETNIDGTLYSLNFGLENSILFNVTLGNSLFNQYYDNYISNIFSPKARVLKIKTRLPAYIITKLKLNNRVIIRDKRYLINNFTTDLTTGEVSFELLTDYRRLTGFPDYSFEDYTNDYNI